MQFAILKRIRSLANGKKTMMVSDRFQAIIATTDRAENLSARTEIWLSQLPTINE
jgi:hypothetical protein